MLNQLNTLRLIAPEFSGVPDATVNEILALAPLFIDVNLYPENTKDLAIVYQACILLLDRQSSISGQSGGGTLISEREGDLERKYSAGTQKSVNIYEVKLQELRSGVALTVMTRMLNYAPTL